MAGAGDNRGMNPWVYDIVLWLLSILLDLFFREVHPRSSWKIPKSGPVIFVAAPHATNSSTLSSSSGSSAEKQNDGWLSL